MREWGMLGMLAALCLGLTSLGLAHQDDGGFEQGGKGINASEPTSKDCLCDALCAYAEATGKNTHGLDADGKPITPEAKMKAAQALEKSLRACMGLGSKLHKGTCICTDANGDTYPFTYAIRARSDHATTSGSQDIVIAIGGHSAGSTPAGNATATNTGDGDALAFGGDNMGSGDGGNATATAESGDSIAAGGDSQEGNAGDATATTNSGDAVASGGKSGGNNTGGNGSANSGTGNAFATGGAGGNAGGSGVAMGGSGGTAAATYGGAIFAASGISPAPHGKHGGGTTAEAGSGYGSSSSGSFVNNNGSV